MKIEIWSDVMCPFCYIGKRKLELALEKFEHEDKVSIIWHSFLLQPNLKFAEWKGIYEFLQESKGLRRDQAEGMTQHVTNMAKEVGLTFDFDKIVVANSFDAHRFIHFAAQQGLQNEAEEKLFAAYFEQGKNVEDHNVLAGIGEELGLDIPKLKEVLIGDAYVQDVKADIQEAQNLNITGVPFFVLNRKYGISGAQPVNIFLEVLEKAYKDEIQQMEVTAEGNSCKDDNC